MNKKWVRNTIGLLIKLLFLALAVIFLFNKLERANLLTALSRPLNLPEILIPLFILLWLLNLTIDAYFWQRVHFMLESVSVIRGLKINLICYALSFITPANSGEWAGRYVMMNEPGNRKKSFFLNFWMHLPRIFSKLMLTAIAACILSIHFNLLSSFTAIATAIILLITTGFAYFSFKRFQSWLHLRSIGRFKMENYMLKGKPTKREKFLFLLLAALKFITYNAQFGLILLLFSPENLEWYIWFVIPVYFMLSSLLPTFAFADFILKSAIAIWVFQPLMQNEALLILASIAIWFFNVVMPSFAGLFVIMKTNLYRSFKKKFSRGSLNVL